MDSGFLRQLLQQAVQAFLIDTMVLHAFGFLRYLCDQPLQLLRRGAVLEVLERGETAPDAGPPVRNVGGPGARGAPSMPARDVELNSPPSPSAAAGTASGPAADNAAATVLMAGVAVAQLGGTRKSPTRVPCPKFASGVTEPNSVPRPQCGPQARPPARLSGSRPAAGVGANLRNCDTGKLISSPM